MWNFALCTVNSSEGKAHTVFIFWLLPLDVGLYILCVQLSTFLFACVDIFDTKSTCGSLRPLESESEVSLYWEEAISTSVDALLRFFSGLQASEISLAPSKITHKERRSPLRNISSSNDRQEALKKDPLPFWEPVLSVVSGAISACEEINKEV